MNANRYINKIENEIEACKQELKEALDDIIAISNPNTDVRVFSKKVSSIEKLHNKLDRLYHNLGRAEYEISI